MSPFQAGSRNHPWASSGCLIVAVLFTATLIFCRPQSAAAQGQGDRSRVDLELEKLELEITKLKKELEAPDWLGAGALGILAGIGSALVTLWAARRARLGALDQAVHEKRLEVYPNLVKATSPLALYFPKYGSSGGSITPDTCNEMGEAISRWYFDGGGLLMSTGARDAYFKLTRALTRAATASSLQVPRFPRDAQEINEVNVDAYRARLSRSGLGDVEKWAFGPSPVGPEDAHMRFKDYVILQALSSDLRTSLAEDLRSRTRPS
jgi:hypothetical protein